MHELSVVLSMIDAVLDEADRRGGGPVEAVHIRLGPLSGVVKDALWSAYELACEGTPLAGSTLVIRDVPVTIYCPLCEAERRVESIQSCRCARCGTPADHVVHGQELEITALELAT